MLGRRWTPEVGGASCQALYYAYEAIRGATEPVPYDGQQAEVIAGKARTGDLPALRAMEVVTWQLANTLYGAACSNVTGGIRAWGPLVEHNLPMLLRLGLLAFIRGMDPTGEEPYHQLVMRTPISVVRMPAGATLRGAAKTARAQLLLEPVAA